MWVRQEEKKHDSLGEIPNRRVFIYTPVCVIDALSASLQVTTQRFLRASFSLVNECERILKSLLFFVSPRRRFWILIIYCITN